MNNYYKYLIWAGTITLAILSLFLIAMTIQILNTAKTANTISFSGEGKALAKPDIAVISMSIITEGVTSKDAQYDNSKKSKAATDFLKEQGIEDKDIKTAGYNIYPQYSYHQNASPEIKGYQANQIMEAKVRDLDKLSDILSGVVSAGINQVNNLSFQIDDPDSLKAEARAKAIENAKMKAGGLEKQLGVRLGRIVNFSESVGGFPGPIFYEKAITAEIDGGGPALPTGENEVVVNVTITYQIK